MGKGHLRGIMYAMRNDAGTLRFADLVDGRNTREYKRNAALIAAGRFAAESALAAGLYVAWTATVGS